MMFQVYLVEQVDRIVWKYTANIAIDLCYWEKNGIKQLLVVDKFFSIGHAESLVNYLAMQSSNSIKKLSELAYDTKIISTRTGYSPIFQTYKKWRDSINQSLQGKLLLYEEVEKFNLSTDSPSELADTELAQNIQLGYLLGDLNLTASVAYPFNIGNNTRVTDLKCERCGSAENINVGFCEHCKDYCATCENCIRIGKSKTCSPLIHFTMHTKLPSFHREQFPVTLSTHQQKISDKAVQFVKNNEQTRMLIWAVTGAGKTEMIYEAINSALEQGNRVLFTVPRKDVVIDLIPRFKRAFSALPIVSLYGGSKEIWKDGMLYIATTHQTIRFKDFFDFIILDELDAYPYHNNTTLQFYVKRSLKRSGKMLMMTATPSLEWQDRVKEHKIESAILPLRYHGYPLPIPTIKIIPPKEKILKSKRQNKLIDKFIKKVIEIDGQAFIFVAKVNEVRVWTEYLNNRYVENNFVGVHANDLTRDKKVEEFKAGKHRFLITTTILERGVTVPNLHILIIGADSAIFTEASLVQIAGRVGRNRQYPAGLVWFLAEEMTNDLVKAKEHINRMNKLAKKIK